MLAHQPLYLKKVLGLDQGVHRRVQNLSDPVRLGSSQCMQENGIGRHAALCLLRGFPSLSEALVPLDVLVGDRFIAHQPAREPN
jgi:hypothetical protein